MSSFLAGLQTRHLWRIVTILGVFWFSATFIFVLSRLSPETDVSAIVGGVTGAAEEAGGKPSTSPVPVPVLTTVPTCGSDDEAGRRTERWQVAETKYAPLLDDKFTIAMSTYKRPKELNDTLKILLGAPIPSLLEIVIVWNNLGEAPPKGFVSDNGVPVRYRASPRNSLNEKLTVDPTYKTRAILLSDDDVYYKPSDLEFVFQMWRTFGRKRLTGALARCALPASNSEGEWHYDFCEKVDVYAMIITNLAFVDLTFMDYYSSDDAIMTRVRSYVDDHMNCEDIAMNFVTSMLTCTGPLLVSGHEPYFSSDPILGISRKPGHLEARSKCLNDFKGMFGFMPLMNETAHVTLGFKSR